MKFNTLVAVIAIFSMAAQAHAYSDGTLRRGTTVAQNDATVVTESEPTQGVVIMNSNTNTNSAAAVAQPTTVVEASPVVESKAESMRKARVSEEVRTEQKIVEKLEESRLKEEQQRAERLFGNKIEAPAAAATATAVATPEGAAATATAVAVEVKPEPKPTQVTIEKVEIIQPKEEISEKPEAVSATKLEAPKEEKTDKWFVGGIIGAPNYSASNVRSNFGVGVSVGMNFATNFVLEGTFLYSNHDIDTYWLNPLYKEMDQYDFSVGAKYYLPIGKLKPYAGASLIYVYRTYTNRIMPNSWAGWADTTSTSEDTNSVNAGLTLGADFEVSKRILLGAGVDYSTNITNRQSFYSTYGAPIQGVKPIEEIDYMLVKITAKMTF